MSQANRKQFRVSKKPVSEKQRIANVNNSRKSTGPVTLHGKNICRYANLQHGLRAETVLAGEEQTYTQRFSKWAEEWGADDDSEKFFVHRAVMSSLRLDRGDVVDVAMIGEHRDAVVNEADLRAGDELDRLIAQLADSPAATIRRLRKTPIGCLWIREQLLIIQTRLEKHRSLLDSQRRRLCHLLGRRIEDFLHDDLTLVPWVVAMVGCLFGGEEVDLPSLAGVFGGQPKGMTAAEFTTRLQELGRMIPDGEKANLALRAHLAEELAKLKEHRELVEALSERNLERDVNQTRIALTPAGKQLEGYVTSQRQSFDSSLRRLAAMQDPRRPRPPGRTPKPDPGDGGSPAEPETPVAASEPRLADVNVAPAAVATENEATVVAEAAIGDCQPPVDRAPEIPALTGVEPAREAVTEPDVEKKTTRAISERKSSSKNEFDELVTAANSGGEPLSEPGAEAVAAGPLLGAGAKEPDFQRFGPYAGILRNVSRNLQAKYGDPGPTDAPAAECWSPGEGPPSARSTRSNPGDESPPATNADPDRAPLDSPLARATEQLPSCPAALGAVPPVR